MTRGTPEVRSDKCLTLLTFDIWYLICHFIFDVWNFTFYILHSTNSTNESIDQWSNEPMDQWTNGPMNQLTSSPMDQ